MQWKNSSYNDIDITNNNTTKEKIIIFNQDKPKFQPDEYRVRIRRSDEMDKQLNDNYIRIVKEKNIRNNNSHIRVLT